MQNSETGEMRMLSNKQYQELPQVQKQSVVLKIGERFPLRSMWFEVEKIEPPYTVVLKGIPAPGSLNKARQMEKTASKLLAASEAENG